MESIKNSLVRQICTATLTIGTLGVSSVASAAIVNNMDTIVQGSLCVGADCATSESFGFDTVRIKENNLRVHFQDTSSSASFASNDWRIVINDTTNGGDNYFGIEDSTAGNISFRVAAGAPSNALFVESTGDVGFGTSNPVVELHAVGGDSPTLRLEQDGSSGFTPQTYDIASNETNFFVRDVTNGSNLVFRIQNGAPDRAINVEPDGDVAFNLAGNSADGSLHVRRTNTTPTSLVLEQTGANVKWEIKANAGTGRMTFKDLNGSTTPFKFEADAISNLLRVGVVSNDVVDIAGDLVINGNCSETDGACADYVFGFIEENNHLPNIPSADAMAENGVSVAHISGRLLEKIEELTLYTLQQHETIAQLNDRIESLEGSAPVTHID